MSRFYFLFLIHNPLRIKDVIHKGQYEINSEFICKERRFLFPEVTLNVSFPTEHSAIFFAISTNTKKVVTYVQFV